MTDIARPARRTVMCASRLQRITHRLWQRRIRRSQPHTGSGTAASRRSADRTALNRSSREGAGTGCCQRPSYRRRDWRIALPQRRKNRAGLFEYLHPPRMCSDPEVFQKRFLLCLPRFTLQPRGRFGDRWASNRGPAPVRLRNQR